MVSTRSVGATFSRTLVMALALGLLGSVGATSASAAIIVGTAQSPVYVAAAAETNNLRVTQTANGVTVWDDDVAITAAPAGCALDTPSAGNVTCSPPALDVFGISIDLLDGNDRTTFTGVIAPVTQDGGTENDTLGAPGGGTVSIGDTGDDTLTAGTGGVSDSQLFGDGGNDTLTGSSNVDHFTSFEGGPGRDTFIGGAGPDLLSYDGPTAVSVTPDEVANDGPPGENDNVRSSVHGISGSDGNDTIGGGPVDNQLNGGDGNDTLTGGAGDDVLAGDEGNDSLNGGAGDDSLEPLGFFSSHEGADDLRGGEGTDSVSLFAFGPLPDLVDRDINVTLDDSPNDGASGEGDNVHSDIEDISTDAGNDTITGNAALQIISGGSGNDNIEGGGGNDFLSGNEGNDTMRARDAFADRVDCGPGTDAAIVDTLDIVSANCESVDRVNVGNANDTPEDRPPTVAFASPAEGARLPGAPLVVSILAADDRAVSRVILLDDGRTVGTDTAAPFQIAYQPTAGDIGRNTLNAIAVDSSEQTAVAVRAITIGKFRPRSLSERVRPTRDRLAPFRFTASGTMLLPAGVTRTQGCRAGTVKVSARRGGRVIASRSQKIKTNCTYSLRVTVRGRGRVSLRATFGGNEVLTSRNSATRNARAG